MLNQGSGNRSNNTASERGGSDDNRGASAGGHGADDPATHQAHHFDWSDAGAQAAGSDDGAAYSGPVNYLQWQYIWSGPVGRAVMCSVDNAFIHGGSGDDAITAHGGHNVLDGGSGSNFLTGGSGADGGSDTFFADGRGGRPVWSTLVNFHAGDDATIWGFKSGVSAYAWAENEGAQGFKGATLHVETHGAGTGVDVSMTFAGMSVADAKARMDISSGSSSGATYLAMHDHG